MNVADDNSVNRAQLDVLECIHAVAQRYGFRPSDLRVTWDEDKTNDPQPIHEVVIERASGSQVSRVSIDHQTMIARDRWHFVPRIDDAITQLWKGGA